MSPSDSRLLKNRCRSEDKKILPIRMCQIIMDTRSKVLRKWNTRPTARTASLRSGAAALRSFYWLPVVWSCSSPRWRFSLSVVTDAQMSGAHSSAWHSSQYLTRGAPSGAPAIVAGIPRTEPPAQMILGRIASIRYPRLCFVNIGPGR